MMASDNATVTELNARAQAYRLGNGDLHDGPAATLRDGLTARAGDVIVTRENNRRLATNRGKDFVKNNDVWTVREVHTDGSLTVRHDNHAGTITLPAEYVRTKTMLGYAATIHRTQGVTCDTTHALISSKLSRSLAYVAASRGRESNHLYGIVDEGETLDDVLTSVAANHDGNLTAHEQMDAARAQPGPCRTCPRPTGTSTTRPTNCAWPTSHAANSAKATPAPSSTPKPGAPSPPTSAPQRTTASTSRTCSKTASKKERSTPPTIPAPCWPGASKTGSDAGAPAPPTPDTGPLNQ
jgi:hypothetical protein